MDGWLDEWIEERMNKILDRWAIGLCFYLSIYQNQNCLLVIRPKTIIHQEDIHSPGDNHSPYDTSFTIFALYCCPGLVGRCEGAG